MDDLYHETMYGRNRESIDQVKKQSKTVRFSIGTEAWREGWSQVIDEYRSASETSEHEAMSENEPTTAITPKPPPRRKSKDNPDKDTLLVVEYDYSYKCVVLYIHERGKKLPRWIGLSKLENEEIREAIQPFVQHIEKHLATLNTKDKYDETTKGRSPDTTLPPDEFAVEEIVGIWYCSEDTGLRFKVKWEGYDQQRTTWERERNLTNCEPSLKAIQDTIRYFKTTHNLS